MSHGTGHLQPVTKANSHILSPANSLVIHSRLVQIPKTLVNIEEDQMRNILDPKTGIQVPLYTMYLDLGQVPALYKLKRFQQLKDQIVEGCQNKGVKSIGKAEVRKAEVRAN